MIVCCGEALIDMLPRTSKEGAAVYQPFNGGSIFNTAIALGRLGIITGFFSGISTDFFGDSLIAGLKASNVDLKYAKIWDKPTTLAFVKLDNGQARYSFYDDNSAGRMLTRKDLPKLSADVNALHFGSISLIAEPGATTLEDLMEREEKDRVICLDPNIRPNIIKDRSQYLERIGRLISMCDILKISDEDVTWITGKTELGAAARKWLNAGAKVVVITRGENGVEAFTKGISIKVPSVNVKVVDTVGAGDTFTAGFLASLQRAGKLNKAPISYLDETSLRNAVNYAARAAAITVSRAGANPPWVHELQS
ncbi:MAG TPA: carbohydrate kinase [Aestuariivirga sp.]